MSPGQFIKTDVKDGIGLLTLNRPKQHNALNREMVTEIVLAMEGFDQDESVRVILLKGEGRSFSAGADIDEMMEDDPVTLELLNQFALWDRLALVKKPIVGAVHGFVFGGGFELALCCDILIAAEGASFSFPEVGLGVMPGAGGTQRLTKLVGRMKAVEWLMTGQRISVEKAMEYGFINRITPIELLEEETLTFCLKLAAQPPLSLRLIKESVHKAVDYPLYEGMQYERKNFYLLFGSEDQKEGMRAFQERRKPKFNGR
ncbi:MAG: enoyl-CoA hydratase/isomerase family protein [Bacillus sp. (in: firmicutes)]